MATTYELITSTVLGSNTSTVTFSSIPSTYTDLILRTSARTDVSNIFDRFVLTINSSSAANYYNRYLSGNGSTASANSQDASTSMNINFATTGATATANTFGNAIIYIPSYTSTYTKAVGAFSTGENASTTSYVAQVAGWWNSTSSITSLSFIPGAGTNFVTGSSFYLYGIKNT